MPAKAPVSIVMRRLAKAIDGLDEPAVEKIARDQQEDPFQVLIATLLSAQTRDAVTHAASTRLFRVARTPEETERALYKSTERRWWPVINLYLVTWGQNVCRPTYPLCPQCVLKDVCPRIGVIKVGKLVKQ